MVSTISQTILNIFEISEYIFLNILFYLMTKESEIEYVTVVAGDEKVLTIRVNNIDFPHLSESLVIS